MRGTRSRAKRRRRSGSADLYGGEEEGCPMARPAVIVAFDPGIVSPGIAVWTAQEHKVWCKQYAPQKRRSKVPYEEDLADRITDLKNQVFGGYDWPDPLRSSIELVVEYPQPPGKHTVKSTVGLALAAGVAIGSTPYSRLTLVKPQTWNKGETSKRAMAELFPERDFEAYDDAFSAYCMLVWRLDQLELGVRGVEVRG
jgi:hypothetical protein